MLITAASSDASHSLVALTTTTGAQLWESELGDQVWKFAIAKDGFIYTNTTAVVAKLDPIGSGTVV